MLPAKAIAGFTAALFLIVGLGSARATGPCDQALTAKLRRIGLRPGAQSIRDQLREQMDSESGEITLGLSSKDPIEAAGSFDRRGTRLRLSFWIIKVRAHVPRFNTRFAEFIAGALAAAESLGADEVLFEAHEVDPHNSIAAHLATLGFKPSNRTGVWERFYKDSQPFEADPAHS